MPIQEKLLNINNYYDELSALDPAEVPPHIYQRMLEYKEWKEKVLNENNVKKYLLNFEGVALLEEFEKEKHRIADDAAYWDILRDVWQCGGGGLTNVLHFQHDKSPEEKLQFLLANKNKLIRAINSDRPHRENFMRPEERQALAAMPEIIRIYRGFSIPELRDGYSWTVDKKRAKWFSMRTKGEYYLLGYAKRSDVIGYLTDREEAEIVIDYRKVLGVETESIHD